MHAVECLRELGKNRVGAPAWGINSAPCHSRMSRANYPPMDKIISHDECGQKRTTDVDRLPDTCPWCRCGIEPINRGYAACETRDYKQWLAVLFRCPRQACDRHFLAFYSFREAGLQSGYELLYCRPQSQPKGRFSEQITQLSQDFVDIYNEALAAQHHGLNQICGPGYRKALEFLIKDYLIAAEPADEAKIKKTPLGDCIKKCDPKVKTTAERAAWLGNDETHYERRWVEKDVADLKILIQLTVMWIQSEILTKQLEADMPAKPQKK